MKISKSLTAYVCLVAAVFSFHLGAEFGETILNYVSYVFVMVGMLLVSKLRPFAFLIVALLSAILYLLYPPKVGIVALAPLIALGFTPIYADLTKGRGSKLVPHVPLFVAIISTLISLVVTDPTAEFKSYNLLSVIFLYLILTQVIFFGKASPILVIFAVLVALAFGNRSGFALILFLFPRFSIANGIKVVALFVIGAFIIFGAGLDQFQRPYDLIDPRILTTLEVLDIFRYQGLYGFMSWSGFNYVYEFGEGFYDFHNSWLSLCPTEHFIGIFKIAIAIVSAFFLPLYWILAIAIRATFDSFFMSNPVDVIYLMLLMKHLHARQLGRSEKADTSPLPSQPSQPVLR